MEPIWSTGGAGSEHAVLADLEWATGVLREAAADVGDAADIVVRAGVASHAMMAARRLEGDLLDTARRVRAVADEYLEAERNARQKLSWWSRVVEQGADHVGRGVWAVRAASWATWLVSPMHEVARAMGGDPVANALYPGAPPTTANVHGDSVEAALSVPGHEQFAELLAMTLWVLERQLGEPMRRSVVATGEACEVGPVSLEAIMADLHRVEHAGGGEVRIARWTDADGVVRRVVLVPGTQDWFVASGNPLDIQANLQAITGGLPDAAQTVVAALRADGAGPDDPVMLAGHSQGGIIATALAASPAIAASFHVRAVVTAGSPTGRIELPANVSALHLEGTRDLVPGLDGKANPETPTRVTVHHDVRRSEEESLAGAGTSVASAHALPTYRETARLVDEGASASSDAWLATNREFLDPGLVTVTRYKPS